MNTTTTAPSRRTIALRVVVTVIVATLLGALGIGSAGAGVDPGAPIEWSTSWTQTETVTVTETATIDGFTGTGRASAMATATATGSATAATNWEAKYWAYQDAYANASAAAKAQADAEARPVAKERAEADARAKAAAAAPKVYETTWTQTETVTVTERATIDGFTGTGRATAMATATATGRATAATNWEAYYWGTQDAYTKASAAAKAQAEAEARPVAKERAEADARARAAAATAPKVFETSWTETVTVTVTESASVGEFTGYGTATATATATEIGRATAATNWEAYYWGYQDAYAKARAAANAKADAEARALAMERALADAQAQADAAATDPPPDEGPDPGTTPSGPTCGPQVLKSDGTPWTCTFSDGFTGTSLDLDKWVPVETIETDFSAGDCFVGLGDNIVVQDGSLRLTTQREPDPVTCDNRFRDVTSQYTSGSVTSTGTFSQTYGRFEIRAAMPQTDGPGLHSALWLTPEDPTYYGTWPHSGEIDIAEFYSGNPDRLIPALHYATLSPWATQTNNNCLVYRPTDFHTYLLEWTTSKITIWIDGAKCVDHTINPLAPLTGSAPFDRPFVINLTQSLGLGDNVPPEGAVLPTATLRVDYVRTWS